MQLLQISTGIQGSILEGIAFEAGIGCQRKAIRTNEVYRGKNPIKREQNAQNHGVRIEWGEKIESKYWSGIVAGHTWPDSTLVLELVKPL